MRPSSCLWTGSHHASLFLGHLRPHASLVIKVLPIAADVLPPGHSPLPRPPFQHILLPIHPWSFLLRLREGPGQDKLVNPRHSRQQSQAPLADCGCGKEMENTCPRSRAETQRGARWRRALRGDDILLTGCDRGWASGVCISFNCSVATK